MSSLRLYKYRDSYVLYTLTVQLFSSLLHTHTFLVQTHKHDVSAPWFVNTTRTRIKTGVTDRPCKDVNTRLPTVSLKVLSYQKFNGHNSQIRGPDYLYIYFAFLFVCLSVCLVVSNKRQNGWTDWSQFFCGASRDPRERLFIHNIHKEKMGTKRPESLVFIYFSQ